MLLTKKTLTALAKALEGGVPIFAAAASLGIMRRTVSRWVATGSAEAEPAKPEHPTRAVDLPGGGTCTEQQFYEHCLLCRILAGGVLRQEGAIAAKLHRKLLGLSTGRFADPACLRYMHKAYAGIHGFGGEQAAVAEAKPEEDAGGPDESITFELPDNGRMSK